MIRIPSRALSSRIDRTAAFLALAPAVALALIVAGSLGGAFPARADDTTDEIETCLGCHSDTTATRDVPGGKVSIYIDKAKLEASVHGLNLKCTDCHPGFGEVPHPERPARSEREFRLSFRDACKKCHFDNYTKAFDGVHFKAHGKGNLDAPLCADCHGAHDVARTSEPRTRISATCSRCHGKQAEIFAKSVHGRAHVAAGDPDVPVCTDCHKSHDIANPHSAAWRVASHEICARCHTDEKRMKKYGLSTKVVDTYLSDFHGMSAALYKMQKGPKGVTAVCADCHGSHDVTKTDEAGSQVLKANLAKTCRKCHTNATDSFPAAWLSHYQPSWQKAPLVYGVGLFYKIFIPFIIGGLILQVLLHFWRVVVNR
jgi:hypothetical protein